MPSSRRSRSDAGVLSLARSMMSEIMGLTPDSIGKVMKVIRNTGQLQDMKVAMRGMNAVSHKRLNQVIDLIEKDKKDQEKASAGKGEEKSEKPEAKEKMAESFLSYILSEYQIDADELRRNPELQADTKKLARANDQQSDVLQKRMSREKIRDEKKAIAAEQDPQRAGLLRKKMNLQMQIQKIDDQLKGTPGEGGI